MSSIKITYANQRELLSAGGASVLDVLHALTDHIDAEDHGNPALAYLMSACEAYKNDRPDATPETRTVEYYRMWDGGQWDTDSIDVPYDTNEEGMDLAVQVAVSMINWRDEIPVFVGVYHIPGEEEDEDYLVGDTCTGCLGPLDNEGACPNQNCSSRS